LVVAKPGSIWKCMETLNQPYIYETDNLYCCDLQYRSYHERNKDIILCTLDESDLSLYVQLSELPSFLYGYLLPTLLVFNLVLGWCHSVSKTLGVSQMQTWLTESGNLRLNHHNLYHNLVSFHLTSLNFRLLPCRCIMPG
jgi:hypothetical protein